jgi:hypothetical protein
MNIRTSPIPLRPDPGAIAERSRRSLARALIASAKACFTPTRDPRPILEKTWPTDDVAAALLVTKTARAPQSTADTALLQSVVEAVVLGASGGGSALLQRGTVLSFGRNAQITLPTLIVDSGHGAFVGEGAPVPVYMESFAPPVVMTPHKLLALWTMTRELLDGSNAETIITEAAKRSLGLTLDSVLFDSVAGDTVRPAGLRNGVAALTASSATDPFEKMLADIGTLLAAVGVVGGPVTLIASTARATMMAARSRGGTLPSVLGSPSIAGGDLIAVATDALAAALAADVEVEASKGATIHMDTTPLAIGTAGTPTVVAAPTRSLFQTDSVGLRLRLPVTWAKRDPAAVAWLSASW